MDKSSEKTGKKKTGKTKKTFKIFINTVKYKY